MALNPALVLAAPALRRPRLVDWTLRAGRRLGWQHVALAALIGAIYPLIGPNGGVLFFPGQRTSDPIASWLMGRYLTAHLPLVFAALVADAAFDDGVHPLRAYGWALLAGAVLAPLIDWVGGQTIGWNSLPARRFAGWFGFALSGHLLQGGLCMAVYGIWRSTQRSLQQVQRAHVDRARDEQRLLTVRLLALQARVEPQLLFDSLSHVGSLHAQDPERADALLADLIALLRAMLPGGAAAVSDVGRELAMVEAWLRVMRALDRPVPVQVEPPGAAVDGCALAPMLVMPLLRAALAEPAWAGVAWCLSVERSPDERLRLALQAVGAATAHGVPVSGGGAALGDLRERLLRLYGEAARLTVGTAPPRLLLELPPWSGERVTSGAPSAVAAA